MPRRERRQRGRHRAREQEANLREALHLYFDDDPESDIEPVRGAIVKVLLRQGFRFIKQEGSHAKFRSHGPIVIVPMGRKDLKSGTTRSIIQQSRLGEDAFDPERHRNRAA